MTIVDVGGQHYSSSIQAALMQPQITSRVGYPGRTEDGSWQSRQDAARPWMGFILGRWDFTYLSTRSVWLVRCIGNRLLNVQAERVCPSCPSIHSFLSLQRESCSEPLESAALGMGYLMRPRRDRETLPGGGLRRSFRRLSIR